MLAIPRPFPWLATLLVLIGIAVLCQLGHWQQERLVWKNALQASLDHEFALPEKDLPVLTTADLTSVASGTIRRGILKGHLDFTRQIVLQGQIVNGVSVSYKLVPLILNDGRSVFVVAGYSPGAEKLLTPATRTATDKITGMARTPAWNYFTPPNEPAQGRWFRPDIAQMADALKLDNALPVLFYAEWTGYKLDALPPVPIEHTLRNDHQNYAYFWYTMAVVLLGIYILRFWRSRRLPQS